MVYNHSLVSYCYKRLISFGMNYLLIDESSNYFKKKFDKPIERDRQWRTHSCIKDYERSWLKKYEEKVFVMKQY